MMTEEEDKSSKKSKVKGYCGAAEASESDRLFTEDLYAALNPIGLKLLDHIVVGENSVFSFADNGIMDEIALAGALLQRA